MEKKKINREAIRKLMLLLSFSLFPITIHLSPGPPIMILKAGVINLSVIIIISIFLSGLFFRRAFCGWICPGGGCQLVAQAINNKNLQKQKIDWIRIVLVTLWVILMIKVAFFCNKNLILDVDHPGIGKFATSNNRFFLPYIPTVIFIFLFVFIFGKRGFCHRGCWIYPIIALSTKFGRLIYMPNLYVKAKHIDNCNNCMICTKNCSMSIDVNSYIQKKNSLPNNCIQCGLCIDKCPKSVLSFAYGIENNN
ncbi:4Fe-4S binding protein [Bacteroidota bacterium]